MANLHLQLLPFSLLCFFPNTLSLWWPSSSSPSPSANNEEEFQATKSAEFTIQGISDSRGFKVVEDAKRKMAVPSTCWHNAYRTLFESCSQIVANEEMKKRLAWLLSDCFQIDSGRPAFPACKQGASVVQCLKRLDVLCSETTTFRGSHQISRPKTMNSKARRRTKRKEQI